MVYRIYVEKRRDIKAEGLFVELVKYLGISKITGVRLLSRYDVSGLAKEDFAAAVGVVFSEPPADMVYYEELPADVDFDKNFVFAAKYLPGVFDQRAQSAVSCCALMNKGGGDGVVVSARVYVIAGDLSEADKAAIKSYVINPVDEVEDGLCKPDKLLSEIVTNVADVGSVSGFIRMDDAELAALHNGKGPPGRRLSMSMEDLLMIRDYFRDTEQRDPTETEILALDTYWSDHCRHSTFLTEIENFAAEDGPYKPIIEEAFGQYMAKREELKSAKPPSMMDLATICAKAIDMPDADVSEEQNAASIVVNVVENGRNVDWLIMFKNETHNHPTEIEPFGGAATCLGGAIRDPLSGRAYVYHAMRVTGAADPRVPIEKTIPGKLPQRKITITAAEGYSSYGNQVGVATGLVAEVYHPGYAAKRMEVGAVVGAVRREHVRRERPRPGDVVILVGGATGRDGIGGAAGSSIAHTNESPAAEFRAEVQKGNAPEERALQRLFRDPSVTALIKKCNDFGAGGVAVAVGELADGVDINLDALHTKYDGLNGTELALSESQERMAVLVDAADADAFIRAASGENLYAVAIAGITGDRRLVMRWRGQHIVNISRDFLDTNGAARRTSVVVPKIDKFPQKFAAAADLKAAWLANLGRLNVACQKGLSERFDSAIGAGTLLMPFGGARQLSPIQAMAAKLPVLNGEIDTCTIMTYGFDPELSAWSPFHAAAAAVVSSVAKIVATGGDITRTRLSFQEYFGKPGDDPRRFGPPMAALLGAYLAQIKLQTPAIGGKDSMSGTFMTPEGMMDVPPTLISFALATERHEHIISPEFKKPGSLIALMPCGRDESDLVDLDVFVQNARRLAGMVKEKAVLSAYAIGTGGLAEALSKMAFGNDIGVRISTDADLFDADYGGFVLELPDDYAGELKIIGKTTAGGILDVNNTAIPLGDALNSWIAPLEDVFPTMLLPTMLLNEKPDILVKNAKWSGPAPAIHPVGRVPKVLIPVFFGSNCEWDMEAGFLRAGAQTEVFVVRSMNDAALRESVAALAEVVGRADIIALPGGFSAADEPDGAGKYIAAVFRTPVVADAVMRFLRKGLMLGICNGFQALIKLGLLPYGEISQISPNSATLLPNAIGRHISLLARTVVTSGLSPWFALCKPGDVHNMPVSHGEGRFAASDAEIDRLIKNGQIAAQYVDAAGAPTMDIRYNPNGSAHAIEALCSPDGRILGKMGHSERISANLYKNVPGDCDQRIFEAAVRYFKG